MRDRIPLHQVALFSGEGATGKSTVQLHLSIAHSLGRDWLQAMPEPGPAIFIDAEDDAAELHRRAKCILAHYGTTFAEAERGGLHLISLAGRDAVLAVANRSGKIEPSPLYQQILEAASDIKPKMIGIASSANVFAGNENDRAHVQQFVGLLTRMAMVADGAVQLISHPSFAGISNDTGVSGTTQWHNAVRARSFLKGLKPEPGQQPNSDLREIVFKKNNYGPLPDAIMLRYQAGLFLPVTGPTTLAKVAQEQRAREVFVALLRRFAAANRYVSDKTGTAYAPALFAREEEAKEAGLNSKALEAAMRALFMSGVIWNEPCGKPSRPSFRIVLK